MWVGTVRACGGLPGVHGDLAALFVTQALPGLINIGLPGYGFELQRQIGLKPSQHQVCKLHSIVWFGDQSNDYCIIG